MSQAINTFYTIAKVPLRLYYSSDRAAKRNTLQSGWVQQAGDYRIVNVIWTNANGDWLQTKPTSGGIPLYAIKDITDSYNIGWIRDDDNITKGVITSVPNSISTEDASFKVDITKMPGSTYTLKFSTNNTEWHSYTGSDSSTGWDSLTFTNTFTSTTRNKLYNAMPNLVSSSVTVTLETTYQGKSLGTDTASFQVSIPASIKPSFSAPVRTLTGVVGGNNYAGLTSLKVTIPTITVPTGASIVSNIIDIGGQRSGHLGVGQTFTRTFNSSGTIPVSVTSTDSRGRSAVYSTTYTVLETKSISIDSFTAIRNGTTGIKITANGQYMATVDGTPTYTITKSIRGANTWTTVATGTTTVSNGRYSIAVTQTSGFTATSAYDLRLVVSGTSTSSTGTSILGTEAVPISFGKHGSGVGVMFNNSNTASLQVGEGGIVSGGDFKLEQANNTFLLRPGSGLATLNTNSSTGIKTNNSLWVEGHVYAADASGSGFTTRLARVDEIPTASEPFTKGSSTNGQWIKFSDGTIIAERKVIVSYTHGVKIPNFAYNMPVTMPTDCYVGVSLRSMYTANSEAETDIFDNFDFLVVGKRGNQWIMKPNLFNRYGSVSYGANNGNWFNTAPNTTYSMHLTLTAIGVV